jgi:tetratricopeptide (TPR) repeat protein
MGSGEIMAYRLKLAAGALALLIGGGLALVLLGIWPGPSEADRQRAREHFAEAETAYQSGDQQAALTALNESIDLDAQNDALRLRANVLLARGEFDAALRDLDKLIGRGGGLAANYSTRCWLRARSEHLDGARADCDRALEIDPALSSAYGNRGLVGLRQGRNHEAWEDFNTAMRVGGSDQWVAWRVFGRGLAARGKGNGVQGRQDMETALRSNPNVAAEYAQFGLGVEAMREFDDATYAAAADPRSLVSLRNYLMMYPNGAHRAEAQAQVDEIYAWIAEDQAAGQQSLPGYSFAAARGPGAPDSFGAIAMSHSRWRVAFSTDYASGEEAERAAAAICNANGVGDCQAFAFRNVCAAIAISRPERARGLAWAHGQDDAVRTAISGCRARGGSACMAVHSQCTPTPQEQTPATAPTP